MLIYSGSFTSEDDAQEFAEPQYTEFEDVSYDEGTFEDMDDPVDAHEREVEPGCKLWEDLGQRVDSEYLEVVYGEARYEYLESLLAEPDDLEALEEIADPDDNTLFIIFEQGENEDGEFTEHPDNLIFCGRVLCNLD